MIYKIDFFRDEDKKQYAYTEFKESDNVDNVKPSDNGFNNYTIEEDIDLEKPVIFFSGIIHSYSDEYNNDRYDYIKTLYVQASSYKEATDKLEERMKLFTRHSHSENYFLNRVCKDERDPVDILLSI